MQETSLNCHFVETRRVLKQLYDASIIDYVEVTGHVSPNPEAFIMSRHLTKFSSMKILLHIQGFIDLPKVSLNFNIHDHSHHHC
jgi:hypothetical protein